MKRTAAVIVTYNRKAMLQRCLRALCTQTAGVPELWVVDNASTDGTAELVAQLNLPTMHYYNTGKKPGWCGRLCLRHPAGSVFRGRVSVDYG